MTRVNIDLPDELHRDAKLAADLEDMDLYEFIQEGIEEKVHSVINQEGLDINSNYDY